MKTFSLSPSEAYVEHRIFDTTPIHLRWATRSEKQKLLNFVRYNRLIDIFLRVSAYSLQNHLRTTVPNMGQIETDELYVAVRNTGQQFVIPVQAKGGTDKIGIVQVQQDIALCREKFPDLTPRPVAVQFKSGATGDVVVMFELVAVADEIKVVDEKHYRLVRASEIGGDDLRAMAATDN